MKTKKQTIRNDWWLLSRLDFIWTRYFPDIPKTQVFIRFGRFAKFRLGSIRLNKKTKETFITITSMFKDQSIPKGVIDHTIAHEMVHFGHGFSSPHRRLHKYPHAGGVVRKEILKRGMGHLARSYSAWIKQYRSTLLRRYV